MRWSRLDTDFRNHAARRRAPSFAWEWEKLDAGVRLGIVAGIDLTVEYADNRFILGSGAEAEQRRVRWRR